MEGKQTRRQHPPLCPTVDVVQTIKTRLWWGWGMMAAPVSPSHGGLSRQRLQCCWTTDGAGHTLLLPRGTILQHKVFSVFFSFRLSVIRLEQHSIFRVCPPQDTHTCRHTVHQTHTHTQYTQHTHTLTHTQYMQHTCITHTHMHAHRTPESVLTTVPMNMNMRC